MREWSHESYRIVYRKSGEDEWTHWRTCGTELRRATRQIKEDRENFPHWQFKIEKCSEYHKRTEWEVVEDDDKWVV